MAIKILPTASHSPFHCFLNCAFMTDICLAYPQFESWFYTNYVNTYATVGCFRFLSDDFLGQDVPFLAREKINKTILTSNNIDVTEFFKTAVDNNRYINTDLDEKYLSYSGRSDTRIHDTFIYGYDDEAEIFYMRGYNRNRTYGSVTATYEEVKRAFEASLDTDTEMFMYIHLLKPKISENTEKYAFDLYKFHTQLDDYVHSTNYTYREAELYSFIDNREEVVFGMECYDMIRENHNNTLRNHSYADTILFHTLCEHKNLMLMRLEYMEKYAFIQKNSEIYQQYRDIADTSLAIRNLVLKYNMTGQASIISKINSLIDKIEAGERKVLPMLLGYTEKEHKKYRIPEYPKLKLNEVIYASDRNRHIGNTQVYSFNVTGSDIYDRAGFDFYNISSDIKVEVRKDNLHGGVICEFDLDSNSCGSCILPYNKPLVPDYGKKLDIFITVDGSAELRSFSFFKHEAENKFEIPPYYITELKDAEKRSDGSILINKGGHIVYSGMGTDKSFYEFYVETEMNDDVIICFDGETKKLEDNLFTFESNPGRHTLTVSADKMTKIKSIYSLRDIAVSSKAAEFDVIHDADKGTTEINGEYVHLTYNGSYIGFTDVTFYRSFDEFHLYASAESEGNGGILEVRLNSPDGELIGECEVTSTAHWDTFREFRCDIAPAIGKHSLYLVWRGENSGNLFNIKSFSFR